MVTAAAVTSSMPSGTGSHMPRRTSACSAMPPYGACGAKKATRAPSGSRPTPSRPTTMGNSVGASWTPLAIQQSDGFSAAAVTVTTASPSPARGAGNGS